MPLEGLQKKICPKLFLDFGKKKLVKNDSGLQATISKIKINPIVPEFAGTNV